MSSDGTMASDSPPFSGAVLCGGASTRMGRDKALIGDPPWAVRVARCLDAAGCEPVCFVGGDQRLADEGWPQIPDDSPGTGPLAAVATFERFHQTPIVIAACDLPNLTPDAVRKLMDAATDAESCAVYELDGVPQWSLMAIPKGFQGRATEVLATGFKSMKAAFGGLAQRVAAEDPWVIADVDEPAG